MRTDELLVVCLGADADPTEALLHATTYRALTVNGIPEARKALTDGSYLLGLLLMGDVPGCTLEAIDALLEQWQSMQWVGVFAPQAVQRDGVRHLILQHLCDFHTWPLDAAVLGYSLRRARAFVDLGKNNIPQQAAEKGQGGSDGMAIVGNSPAVVELRRHIKKVSHVNAPVLIWGESGSGKELVALAIHQHSRRAAKPFVAMNCGAVSASLIQSELFGYARGAFTGAVKDKRGLIESAEGGTLFLDEVGDLALDLQVNLLRFLQERTIMRVGSSQPIAVDVRVIAASHGRLDGAVRAGHFREDLLYRLNVLPVSVPALRERKEDIALLAQHFFRQFETESGARLLGFGSRAMSAMSEQAVFEDMFERSDQDKIRREGFSLLDIKSYLARRGFVADAFELPLQKLVDAGLPALVLISEHGYNHFVVIKGMRDGRILVGDPSSGTRAMLRDRFESLWQKNAAVCGSQPAGPRALQQRH